MNQHDGHTATCLCCTELSSEYDGGYSEQTPGDGMVLTCKRGHFHNTGGNWEFDTKSLHVDLRLAENCKDFCPRKGKK